MKVVKIIGKFLFNLFILGFFGISAYAIYTVSYTLLKCGIIIGYIIISFIIINLILKSGRKVVWNRGEPEYLICKSAIWLSILVGIFLLIGLIFLIGLGIIEKFTVFVANWLSVRLHVEGGKMPRIEL